MMKLRPGGVYEHLVGKAEGKSQSQAYRRSNCAAKITLATLLKWGVLTITQEVLMSDVQPPKIEPNV